jgi:hypothetical protein
MFHDFGLFGWRQSIAATLKANTFGIRFDFYAPVQRTGRPLCGQPARSPAPCIFARYTPAQK